MFRRVGASMYCGLSKVSKKRAILLFALGALFFTMTLWSRLNISTSSSRDPDKTSQSDTSTTQTSTRRNKFAIYVGERPHVCETLLLDLHGFRIVFVFAALGKHSSCEQFNHESNENFNQRYEGVDDRDSRVMAAFHYAIEQGAEQIRLINDSALTDASSSSEHHHRRRPLGERRNDYAYVSKTNSLGEHFCDAETDFPILLCSGLLVAVDVMGICSPGTECTARAPSVVLNPDLDLPLPLVDIRATAVVFYAPGFYLLPVALLSDRLPSAAASRLVTELSALHNHAVRVLDCDPATAEADPSPPPVPLVHTSLHQSLRSRVSDAIAALVSDPGAAALLTAWYRLHSPRPRSRFARACTPTHYARRRNLDAVRRQHNATCAGERATMKQSRWRRVDFDRARGRRDEDLLLVVVFNANSHLEVALPHFEVMYRPFYRYMLYCVPEWRSDSILDRWKISYISYGDSSKTTTVAGAYSYNCSIIAMSLGYKVKGYLTVADDLIILPENMRDLSTHRVWKVSPRVADLATFRECRLGTCDYISRWKWNTNGTLAALADLRRAYPAAMTAYRHLTGGGGEGDYPAHPSGAFSDIFYVPESSVADRFSAVAAVFLERRVFVEIAVATALTFVAGDAAHVLEGHDLWEPGERSQPWTYFAKRVHFSAYLHPVKLSYVEMGAKGFVRFYCNDLLVFMHDPLSRTLN